MHHTFALLIAWFGIPALVPQDTTAVEKSWQTYGYIALGAVVLIVIVVVLVSKQYRKFNE